MAKDNMEDYKKLYEDLVDRVKTMAKAQPLVTKKAIEMHFPEIVESEDERIRKELIGFCNSCATGQTSILVKDSSQWKRWIAWLEKQSEQNPAWSEEDELMLEGVIDRISDLGTGEMIKDWLKSLKERVQPKVELTQLDKKILEAAIAFVEHNNHFNCWRGVDKHTVLSALHSFRPQPHWKPSDKQINALKLSIGFVTDDFNEHPTLSETLKELLKQLKSL